MIKFRHRDGPHRTHQHQERHQFRYALLEAQRRGYELHYMEMADLLSD